MSAAGDGIRAVETPRDASGRVDYNQGWKLWSDTNLYYPSAVHRRRLIANWIAPLRPRSILDAGCGPGRLLFELHQRLPDAACVGVDSADETIGENRGRFPWGRFEPLDLASSALAERFDVVVCTEVLEHVEDDERALRNLVAMTERYLLLTVPTGPIFPLEAGFGHLRHYQLEPLSRRVEGLGLEVRRRQAWGFPWMNAFKRAANLRPEATLKGFGSGQWSWFQKAVGRVLTGLFYLNLPKYGPQLLLLAEVRARAARPARPSA